MRTTLIVSLLAVAALALSDTQHWASFKARYGRLYSKAEENKRFGVFVENLRKAETLSAKGHAVFGITKFSDLTTEEFVRLHAGHKSTAVDWSNVPSFNGGNRKAQAVGTDWTPLCSTVKNQGSCGSCWAFSAAGAAEGCYAVKNKKAVDLSPQQIMDCCDKGSACNGGCQGGQEYVALEWATQNDLYTFESYPYRGAKGVCRSNATVALPANTCNFYKIDKDEAAIAKALTYGMVTIALDATELQTYVGGVITECPETDYVNHALLLVSDQGTKDAYVVKNSWGEDWGENGYFRMTKSKGCLGLTLDYSSVAF